MGTQTDGQLKDLWLDGMPGFFFNQVTSFLSVLKDLLTFQVAKGGQKGDEDDPLQVEQSDSHFSSSFLYFPQDEFDCDGDELVEGEASKRTDQADELKPKVEFTQFGLGFECFWFFG